MIPVIDRSTMQYSVAELRHGLKHWQTRQLAHGPTRFGGWGGGGSVDEHAVALRSINVASALSDLLKHLADLSWPGIKG